jgi:hypothetical protein
MSLEVSFYASQKQTEMKARWHDMQLKDFHNFLWLHLSVNIGSDFGHIGLKKRRGQSKRLCRSHLEALIGELEG